jgi:hypothetical protein
MFIVVVEVEAAALFTHGRSRLPRTVMAKQGSTAPRTAIRPLWTWSRWAMSSINCSLLVWLERRKW